MWVWTKDFIPHEQLGEAIFYPIDNPSMRQVDHIRKQIVVDVHCRHASLLMVKLYTALRYFDDVLICIELRTFQQYDDGLVAWIQWKGLRLENMSIFIASCLCDHWLIILKIYHSGPIWHWPSWRVQWNWKWVLLKMQKILLKLAPTKENVLQRVCLTPVLYAHGDCICHYVCMTLRYLQEDRQQWTPGQPCSFELYSLISNYWTSALWLCLCCSGINSNNVFCSDVSTYKILIYYSLMPVICYNLGLMPAFR